ncbi:MAG: hypothetical protein WD651_04270 [Acidimicrobiia bacterium]
MAFLFTDIRVFCRVVAGVLGYGWSVYLALKGGELEAALSQVSETVTTGGAGGYSLAYLIPSLLSIMAIWAAVVAEEGILWTMSISLVLFSAIFVFSGGLLLAPVAVGHLLITALSRPLDRPRTQTRIPHSRRPK